MRGIFSGSLVMFVLAACGGTTRTNIGDGGTGDGSAAEGARDADPNRLDGVNASGGVIKTGDSGAGDIATGGAVVCANPGPGLDIVDTCDPQSGNRIFEYGQMMAFEAPPVAIVVGGLFGAIKRDGTVAIWGRMDISAPPPKGLTNVKALALGEAHALALTGDGVVVAWGSNTKKQTDLPAELKTSKVKLIAAAGNFSLAVTEANTLVGWGEDTMGQVSGFKTDPQVKAALDGATLVGLGAIGGDSSNPHDLGFALKDDGTVVSWGDKYSPTGGTAYVDSSTLNKKVVAMAGGDNHALALFEDGTIGHWGRCWKDECSLPETSLTGIKAIAAGGRNFHGFSFALKADGTLVSVGATGPSGSTAYNSEIYNTVPAGLTNIKAIAAGSLGLLALTNDGQLYSWVARQDPRTSTFGYASVLQRLPTTPIPCVAAVASGSYHSLALKTDGTVIGWGDNSVGQLDIPKDLHNVKAIAAGRAFSLALRSDGTIVHWGYGTKPPAGLCDIAGFATTNATVLARKVDGSLISWGDTSEATKIPAALPPIADLAIGYRQALAVQRDGGLVTWGYGGSTIPTEMGNQPITDVAVASDSMFALKQDGTVFGRGLGWVQTGFPVKGTAMAALSPAKVIAASLLYLAAIKTDGSLWFQSASVMDGALPLDAGPFKTVALSDEHLVAILGD